MSSPGVWGRGYGQHGSGGAPEKRCRLGGPAVREEGPVKLPLDRAPKEEPLPLTKLLSLDGNSSPSSDVSLWFAANVCNTHPKVMTCVCSKIQCCMCAILVAYSHTPPAGLTRLVSVRLGKPGIFV